jgi:hypothetical protein
VVDFFSSAAPTEPLGRRRPFVRIIFYSSPRWVNETQLSVPLPMIR